jgi:hypothetical protein
MSTKLKHVGHVGQWEPVVVSGFVTSWSKYLRGGFDRASSVARPKENQLPELRVGMIE